MCRNKVAWQKTKKADDSQETDFKSFLVIWDEVVVPDLNILCSVYRDGDKSPRRCAIIQRLSTWFGLYYPKLTTRVCFYSTGRSCLEYRSNVMQINRITVGWSRSCSYLWYQLLYTYAVVVETVYYCPT